MGEFGPQQLGKLVFLAGVVISLVGVLIIFFGHLGLFRLPGDFEFGGKNWKVYLPIASSIIISIILTLVFWLINHLRH